jgi:hypothetical protein
MAISKAREHLPRPRQFELGKISPGRGDETFVELA